MWVYIQQKLADSFKGIDIISARDFSRKQLDTLFRKSKEIEEAMDQNPNSNEFSNSLKGKTLANMFYEPSTRTRISFESAMKKLGGRVIGFDSSEGTSVQKGESLADTIRTIESLFINAIALRHHLEGAAQEAADFAQVPIINAGDGAREHPTQTLLDLYSIWREKGTIDGLTMALAGDLKYGRTVHSLSYALPLFKIEKLYLVSPEILRMRKEYLDFVKEKLDVKEMEDFRSILPKLDVIYITRIQKERFPDKREYEKIKGSYQLTAKDLGECKKDMIILHPLPRVDEIAPEVDNDPRALYFRQIRYGMIVRMGLLYLMLR